MTPVSGEVDGDFGKALITPENSKRESTCKRTVDIQSTSCTKGSFVLFFEIPFSIPTKGEHFLPLQSDIVQIPEMV